ncbi:unnamed protein product [Paramecium sonneborni]|uniref:Uncharacterized protein n=1 Tax=Paramecium sonneborni TaxID=65129 RepID=A0A8S1QLB0_9CILI|nr:unnamed protein product [Paramecium sonneborni]
MEFQIKKLTTVVNQISTKLEQFKNIQNFDYKQFSDLSLELNQINAETSLLIQQAINIDVSQLIEKTFNCIQNLLMQYLTSKEQLNQQKKNNQNSPIQLIDHCTQCMNLQQNCLGGVSISQQGNPNIKIKNASQVPWYEAQQQNQSQQKRFIEKYTCTTEDYYQNCTNILSGSYDRQMEFESMIQFANESIAIMGEALSNRVLQQFKEKGKPEELNKLIHAIKFKKEDIDQILKSVDLSLLKDNIDNYEKVEEQLRQHIIQVQKQTAERVFIYCKTLFKEKFKMGKFQTKDHFIRQTTLVKQDDCRCQIYVGEIVSLQNKTEQQISLLNKQTSDLKDKDRIIQGLELQIKLFENQIKQHLQDKQELKQKIEQQSNLQRRSTVFQRQSSFMVNYSQNEDPQDMQISNPNLKIIKEERQSQTRILKAPSLQPFVLQNQIQSENLNTEQMNDLIKKDKMLERLIVLTNALDKTNKDRRLSQLQYVVEQKGDRQLLDMLDLIKDIEDNDLLIKETRSFGNIQSDNDELRSPMNISKHFHSQQLIDQVDQIQKQKFLSTKDLNSPKVLYLEQIKEIDENKHILLVPIEQSATQGKLSKNTSQSSCNDSNQGIEEISPQNKKQQRFRRTSSNVQQIIETKNNKLSKRTNSIKLKSKRKVSNQNNSNEAVSNVLLTSNQPILNSGTLTDRLPVRSISQQQQEQYKYDKMNENELISNKIAMHNTSLHDKPFINLFQQNHGVQYYTPNNSSRLIKIKNQNQDKIENTNNNNNIINKQINNHKPNLEINNHIQLKQEQQIIISLQQSTKFQQQLSQQQFLLHDDQERTMKKQLQTDKNQYQQFQYVQENQIKPDNVISSINIISEVKKQQNQQNQRSKLKNLETDKSDKNSISPKKLNPQNNNSKPTDNLQKWTGVESAKFITHIDSSIKTENFNYRPQTTVDNIQLRDNINKQKEEYEKKQKEERIMFDQGLFDLPEQQEELLIRNATNNIQGSLISEELNDNIMRHMYKNLNQNQTQITQTINKFYQRSEEQNLDYAEFQNFINKFQNLHKRCGKDCIHVTRFYMRLGFIPLRYLNKRKAIKLAKPVVLPGFQKLS